jgi:hypothetical protein
MLQQCLAERLCRFGRADVVWTGPLEEDNDEEYETD